MRLKKKQERTYTRVYDRTILDYTKRTTIKYGTTGKDALKTVRMDTTTAASRKAFEELIF